MKKFAIITLTVLVLLTTAGCSQDPYVVDISYQSKEVQANNQKLLQESLDKYGKASTEDEKAGYATEIGFRYMQLGNYREAIKYYEEVIKNSPGHFAALNNIAAMYEEAGDLKKALEYEQKLYQDQSTNSEVVADTIRLLVKNSQFSDAQGVLDAFSKYDKKNGPNYTDFISDQFSYIADAQAKTTKK